jgi:hypothetical protein
MERPLISFLSKLLEDDDYKVIIKMIYDGKSDEEIIEKLIGYKKAKSDD